MTVDAGELLTWYDARAAGPAVATTPTSAWQILVSEFMLQQTPVARVEPIWLDWVARWPTPSATAAASAADVLRAWGKLGYPRRAKRLHECATHHRRRLRRPRARRRRDVADAARRWRLHRAGRGVLRLRAERPRRRHQRAPRRRRARCTAGPTPPASARDLADVAALLPDGDEGPRFSVAMMELGATVCTARSPRCGVCPLSRCAWRSAGFPPASAPARRPQRYAGTDRQVRGKLLDVLRGNTVPVTRAQLDVVWLSDTAQRDRALDSLLVDGLVEQTADGLFALAGEGGESQSPRHAVN